MAREPTGPGPDGGMGGHEPAGEVYTTVGGDPVGLGCLRYRHHGFDGAVPADSPLLEGAANKIVQTHGKLLSAQGLAFAWPKGSPRGSGAA